MEEILIRKKNSSFLHLTCSQHVSVMLGKYFSIFVPNFKFDIRYKRRIWDGKKKFFDRRFSTLPIGLFPQLAEFSKENNFSLKLDFPAISNTISSDFDFHKYLSNTNLQLRDYQTNSIKAAISKRRGVIKNATGSGKQLLIYILSRIFLEHGKKVLVIVPGVSLVEQMYLEFKNEYKWEEIDGKISLIYSGSEKINENAPIVVSTFQSISDESEEFYSSFDVVLVDETHKAKSKSIEGILLRCVNADFRFGFTGSLYKDKCDLFTIFGCIGPVIYEVNSNELQERNILSTLKINLINVVYNETEREMVAGIKYPKEKEFILSHKNRYEVVAKILDKIDEKENIIILTQEIRHLKATELFIRQKFPDKKVFVTYGAIDVEERLKIHEEVESGRGVIFISTYGVASTGINIIMLHNIIFWGPIGKSVIKVIQTIGRGLRKSDDKNSCSVWDVVDNLSFNETDNFMYKHYKERLKIYKSEKFSDLNRIQIELP